MKIYKISLAVLALLIIGTSIAGAFPGQTSACDNCHTISPSIIVSADVTSTLTVNPGQAFTVGITYSGGLSTGETEVNWPIVLDNPLFNASPRIPVPASAASNGTTSSVLTAPATPGLYTTRVYASSGTGTTPDGSNFSDISVMVQTPSIPNNINLDVDMPVRTTFIGINATYILTLNNSGTVMDNYTLTVDNPDGATIASLSTYVVQNLAPGANTTVFLNVTNAVQGKFRVNVTGTSMGDSTRMASVNTTTIVNAQAAMTWHVRAGGQTEDMAIQGMAFYPGIIIVNAGDTIMWEIGGNFHTISFLSGQAPPPGGSPESLIPSGDLEYNGTGFVSSGILPTGGNYSLKFTEPGIFSYMCLIHPGMQGIVIVQPSGSKYPFTQEEYNNRSEMDMQKDIDVGKDLVDKAKLMVTSSPGPDNTTMWKTFIDIPLPEMVDVNLEQINSSANGNATLNIINPTDLNVMINVTGLEPDSNNTANIKIGTCDFPGSTVFSLGNITADSDGKGSFVTDISVLPGFGIMNRGWIVDIENETQPVACGNVIKHDAAYMRFVPSNLTINQGDNVEWTQLNPMEIHTVSFPEKGQTPPEFLLPGYLINPEAALPSGVDGYNGTGYYNSGILTPGASYNLTFTKPGTYDYLCLIHDEMGMIGKVIVLPPEEQMKLEQINLVSDVPNLAQITDPNLVNPWGMARSPTGPWWIADNGMGVSTVYNGTGKPFPANNPLVITVPPPNNGTPPSTPTGIVFNGASDFEVASGKPARFIFVTEDGTISGWNSSANSTSAILKVDNSPAVYKGVTIAQKGNASFLYVANFSGGSVDVFDTDFKPVELAANAFTDKNIPADFAPFNVQYINGKIFVTFAEQDAQKHDNLDGPGLGFVDVFDTSGNLLMSLEHGNWMNAPWGIVLAPSDFGSFSEELLVGNFGSGQIAAFDPENGNFHDTLRNISGEEITIEGLWGLGFGNGANAGPNNTLFFTAGINDETHGIFGTFLPAPELAGSISGMKFNDSNGNGMKDIGESGLSNWTIMLKNSTGSIVDMMMTDSEGNYTFEGLVAGNYSVEEVLQADWMQTFPSTGIYFVNITNGENVKDKDFGNIMKVTSTNLIENPGFESGTSPWVFYTNGLGSFGVILSRL